MTALETIDRLCSVATQQAEIIREQAMFIEQMNTIDEETKNHFAEKRSSMDKELGLIKAGLFSFHNAVLGEGGN